MIEAEAETSVPRRRGQPAEGRRRRGRVTVRPLTGAIRPRTDRPSRLLIDAFLYPERSFWRPRTRADCANIPRPCPFVGCRYHLYLDVMKRGLVFNFPDREVWELEHSCALDLADATKGKGNTTTRIGEIMGWSKQNASQTVLRAVQLIKERVHLRVVQ